MTSPAELARQRAQANLAKRAGVKSRSLTESEKLDSLEAESAAINKRINDLLKASREEAKESEAREKLEFFKDKGDRGDYEFALEKELKRLRQKAKSMKDEIALRATPVTNRVIVEAGRRPPRAREVLIALTTDELYRIVMALDRMDKWYATASDKPVHYKQCDRGIVQGQLSAYLMKCAVLCKAYGRVTGEGDLVRAFYSDYMRDAAPIGDWPDDSEEE